MRIATTLALIAAAGGAYLAAQEPAAPAKAPAMHRVTGGARDGASAFPRVTYTEVTPKVRGQLDFQHYHTYEETVSCGS